MKTLQKIKNLQAELPRLKCDALLIDDAVNLEYLTGLRLPEGKLIVYPKSAVLCVHPIFIEECREQSPVKVQLFSYEKGIIPYVKSHIQTLGFIANQITYTAYKELKKQSKERSITLVPIEDVVKDLRSIKDPEEIQLLKKAAALGSEGYDYIVHNLKEGISEAELAFMLEYFWKKKGAERLAFDPVIAFGANSSKPHYLAGPAKLKKGDIILIDIGVVLNRYHSDMTRTVFFGEPHPKLKEIYQIVQKAQQAALKICKPGTTFGELDEAARNLIKAHGYGDSYTHGLGHGVGLELHEYPFIPYPLQMAECVLKPGMAVTVEPGIYLPGVGGVRIEDLVVITDKGHINLTKRPTDLMVLRP